MTFSVLLKKLILFQYFKYSEYISILLKEKQTGNVWNTNTILLYSVFLNKLLRPDTVSVAGTKPPTSIAAT